MYISQVSGERLQDQWSSGINSFKIRSESQALFNLRPLMLLKTSCSVIVEFSYKLCWETVDGSIA